MSSQPQVVTSGSTTPSKICLSELCQKVNIYNNTSVRAGHIIYPCVMTETRGGKEEEEVPSSSPPFHKTLSDDNQGHPCDSALKGSPSDAQDVWWVTQNGCCHAETRSAPSSEDGD